MWLRTIWHVVQSVLRVLMIELSFNFKVFLGDYEMKICSTWDSMNFLFFFCNLVLVVVFSLFHHFRTNTWTDDIGWSYSGYCISSSDVRIPLTWTSSIYVPRRFYRREQEFNFFKLSEIMTTKSRNGFPCVNSSLL